VNRNETSSITETEFDLENSIIANKDINDSISKINSKDNLAIY